MQPYKICKHNQHLGIECFTRERKHGEINLLFQRKIVIVTFQVIESSNLPTFFNSIMIQKE